MKRIRILLSQGVLRNGERDKFLGYSGKHSLNKQQIIPETLYGGVGGHRWMSQLSRDTAVSSWVSGEGFVEKMAFIWCFKLKGHRSNSNRKVLDWLGKKSLCRTHCWTESLELLHQSQPQWQVEATGGDFPTSKHWYCVLTPLDWGGWEDGGDRLRAASEINQFYEQKSPLFKTDIQGRIEGE